MILLLLQVVPDTAVICSGYPDFISPVTGRNRRSERCCSAQHVPMSSLYGGIWQFDRCLQQQAALQPETHFEGLGTCMERVCEMLLSGCRGTHCTAARITNTSEPVGYSAELRSSFKDFRGPF